MDSTRQFFIRVADENCVGCNRCIRACPIETANIAFEDEKGKIRVRLDNSQCIHCGACIDACDHSARVINDDTERFFADLEQGLPVAVMLAPAVRSNLPEWRRLITWLKRLGAVSVYDVSLGADICIWAHLRYLENNPRPIIT
ncbi:4Fe-4S dicluster domain-containing protein [Desulfovibrio sp. OttesenSCG-928-F20]|nr:4Fe-4S dicluster domain-containing protein [Desulfovibrio sp. OttesenSCG-928-F20]